MRFLLGLTGSMGMGKSTTAKILADSGCKIWDADAAVHRLYSKNGMAVQPIGKIFPNAVVNDAIDRTILKDVISNSTDALPKIEKIVHPLVVADRNQFKAENAAGILVFDVPLLFEISTQSEFDAVAVVHTSKDRQIERILGRETMTKSQIELILDKQMPSAEKLNLADYGIRSDSMETATKDVDDMLVDIKKRMAHA